MRKIVAIYFAAIVVLVCLAVVFPVPFYFPNTPGRWPTPFLLLFFFMYYVVPLMIAVAFGFIFRPFWRHFRNLFFTIFLIQILYSAGAQVLRIQILGKIKHDIDRSKSIKLPVKAISQQLLDENNNGIVDTIEFVTGVDLEKYPIGEYLIYEYLTQLGQQIYVDMGAQNVVRKPAVVTPHAFAAATRHGDDLWKELIQSGYIDREGVVQDKVRKLQSFSALEDFFCLRKESPPPESSVYTQSDKAHRRLVMTLDDRKRQVFEAFQRSFREAPAVFEIRSRANFAQNQINFTQGELELNVGIRKVVALDEYRKRVVFLSRWAPFLRGTSWDGKDPDITVTTVDLDLVRRVDVFSGGK